MPLTMNTTETHHRVIIPIDNQYFKLGVILLFVTIFTLSSLENVLLIIAVCQTRIRHREKGKYSRYLIANMCLANLSFTIIMVPFTIHFSVVDKNLLQNAYVQASGFFVELLTSAMIASIIGITIERLMAVLYPLHYRRCANKPSILLLSFVGWVVSAVIATVPFIGFIFIKSEPYTFSESFSIFFFISCNSHMFYRFYTIFFCFTSYIVPLMFIVLAYSRMYRSVLHISRDIRQQSLKRNHTAVAEIKPNPSLTDTLSHSMSSPNLIIESNNAFFSSKKTLLDVEDKLESRRWRKISANSFFKTASKTEISSQKRLSRCNSENQTTRFFKRSTTSTNSSKMSMEMTSFIRKGSKICSKKIRGIFSQKEEINAAKTCLIVVTAFIFLISPYFILLIIQAFHTNFMDHNIVWNTLSVVLLYINCIVTPAIYVYRDSVVFYEVRHLWNSCLSKKDSIPMRKPSVRSRCQKTNGGRTNIEVIVELEEKHFIFDTTFCGTPQSDIKSYSGISILDKSD